MLNFSVTSVDKDSKARTGVLNTSHGPINTPIFMPVGTLGSVKGVHTRELINDVNAEIILGNTYHLYLRPGLDVINKAGGLHQFIGWPYPILTDSGGYQVYSLGESRIITEEGVTFKSHIDGSLHTFTPENVIETQRIIGADIIMAFDECPPYPADYNYVKESMHLTHRWLERCNASFKSIEPKYGYSQILYPIIQGGTFDDLRKESTEYCLKFSDVGIAIGGLSVGEPVDLLYEHTKKVCELIPNSKARYLMGVGTPANILEAISYGVDMFDCVMPTRNGRNGMLFTVDGIINIKNEKWKEDYSAIDSNNPCYVSQNYSKAYLRHLIVNKEMLGAQICSIHNLSFYLWLVNEARKHIKAGSYLPWKNKMIPQLENRL